MLPPWPGWLRPIVGQSGNRLETSASVSAVGCRGAQSRCTDGADAGGARCSRSTGRTYRSPPLGADGVEVRATEVGEFTAGWFSQAKVVDLGPALVGCRPSLGGS